SHHFLAEQRGLSIFDITECIITIAGNHEEVKVVRIINQSLVKNDVRLYCENAIYPSCKIG
ncbi:MAG: hypothetical protein ABSF99_04885, partial [Anaerolineales bacterium]